MNPTFSAALTIFSDLAAIPVTSFPGWLQTVKSTSLPKLSSTYFKHINFYKQSQYSSFKFNLIKFNSGIKLALYINTYSHFVLHNFFSILKTLL